MGMETMQQPLKISDKGRLLNMFGDGKELFHGRVLGVEKASNGSEIIAIRDCGGEEYVVTFRYKKSLGYYSEGGSVPISATLARDSQLDEPK